MKTRTGFVSNSSSSSFVAFGKITKSVDEIIALFSQETIEEAKKCGEDDLFYALQDLFYNSNNLWMARGTDNGLKKDEYFIGIMLADHIEEGDTEARYSFEEVVKQIHGLPLKKQLELDECQFIATTRSC